MKTFFTLILITIVGFIPPKAFSLPILNSLPGAPATIFLDFDGHTVISSFWNNGSPIYCATSGMTDLQIIETFNRVAEDFRPFQLNITTDSAVFLAAPLYSRMRMIITPTNYWMPNTLGVSYVGAFSYGSDIPSFVFCNRLGPNNPKYVAGAIAHEGGHTIGLRHQALYGTDCNTPITEYYQGVGTGETGWAPLMGYSLNKNLTNWNYGPNQYGCTNIEDNLSIIISQNGFGYRVDDYAETMNASTTVLPVSNFSQSGIITTNTDRDAFRINLASNLNVHFNAVPYNVGTGNEGANLDIKLELHNSSGALIRTYDPQNTLNVTIDTVLNAGTYYFIIDGTGNANVGEYGSLGSYTFSGASGPLPIHDVTLSGNTDKGKHNLNWKITADEPIRTIVIESSTDGINYRPLASVTPTSTKFSYASYVSNTIFYRLKVTSVLDQTVYSNTIAIIGASSTDKSFYVSTLVQSEITVNAPANYQYVLNDMNGRIIGRGIGIKGVNRINISNQQTGMYFIQLFNIDKRQTERIIKQ